ncbi:PREDICTED: uncharacterized protein LOC104733312 [Camelina sativa]|uniref:Uncharacterized protein LOC104733312 n=1 Tax=Camelina sativa TaxID=90675 RepID=A0ABM0V5R2_CAMSA|nr:PREDICTED: uncharacterized protein LOC104733312 [Camelina sativa]
MSYQTSPTIPGDFADDVEWCDENWPELEFRSPEDEAWYAVEVAEMCDALLISFNGFTCDFDEFYPSDDFKSSDEIQEFEERFRACSVQMQDTECPTVTDGTKVCATFPSVTGDVKFYDAIVVTVERTKHERDEEGSEVCGCSFKVYWKQGPWANQVTSAKVGDICLRAEDNRMNPIVVSFLKEARRKLTGEAFLQGEETEWQKILKKVNSAIEKNLSLSLPENHG